MGRMPRDTFVLEAVAFFRVNFEKFAPPKVD